MKKNLHLHYTSASLDSWHKAVWVHGSMLLTPNSDPTICSISRNRDWTTFSLSWFVQCFSVCVHCSCRFLLSADVVFRPGLDVLFILRCFSLTVVIKHGYLSDLCHQWGVFIRRTNIPLIGLKQSCQTKSSCAVSQTVTPTSLAYFTVRCGHVSTWYYALLPRDWMIG